MNLSYLWDGSEEGWGLLLQKPKTPQDPSSYGILNFKSHIGLLIEDEAEHRFAVARMLGKGVEVHTSIPWAKKSAPSR